MAIIFGFNYRDVNKLEIFHTMMWEKYPDIIGRKRFCCTLEEQTDQLVKDCLEYGVTISPISHFRSQTFTAPELIAIRCVLDCNGVYETKFIGKKGSQPKTPAQKI